MRVSCRTRRVGFISGVEVILVLLVVGVVDPAPVARRLLGLVGVQLGEPPRGGLGMVVLDLGAVELLLADAEPLLLLQAGLPAQALLSVERSGGAAEGGDHRPYGSPLKVDPFRRSRLARRPSLLRRQAPVGVFGSVREGLADRGSEVLL